MKFLKNLFRARNASACCEGDCRCEGCACEGGACRDGDCNCDCGPDCCKPAGAKSSSAACCN
jgi:hypothetical protein